MARLTDEEVLAFVVASCAAQGVPVKVTDPLVLGKVALLLGSRGRTVRGPRQRVPAVGPAPSEAPGDVHPVRVEGSGAGAGTDRGPIDHGGDDGGLPGEVEFGP